MYECVCVWRERDGERERGGGGEMPLIAYCRTSGTYPRTGYFNGILLTME